VWSLLPEWAESDKSLLDFVTDTVVLTSTSTGTCDEFFLSFAFCPSFFGGIIGNGKFLLSLHFSRMTSVSGEKNSADAAFCGR
jgi:hypothetical protein